MQSIHYLRYAFDVQVGDDILVQGDHDLITAIVVNVSTLIMQGD